jgi:hypothetical protein
MNSVMRNFMVCNFTYCCWGSSNQGERDVVTYRSNSGAHNYGLKKKKFKRK